MNLFVKLRMILCAMACCTITACAFLNEPIDAPGAPSLPAPGNSAAVAQAAPAPVAPAPPPLPSPSRSRETTTAINAEGTYFMVSTIFEIPDNVPDLSFVHFTNRSNRREKALCEAMLNAYSITPAANIPTSARSLIIWPIVEGTTANNCNEMLEAHEPLDLSRDTAQSVSAKGPYILSRNSPQQKQMIYNLSSVSTGDLADALTEWQQVLGSGGQNWPALVRAR